MSENWLTLQLQGFKYANFTQPRLDFCHHHTALFEKFGCSTTPGSGYQATSWHVEECKTFEENFLVTSEWASLKLTHCSSRVSLTSDVSWPVKDWSGAIESVRSLKASYFHCLCNVRLAPMGFLHGHSNLSSSSDLLIFENLLPSSLPELVDNQPNYCLHHFTLIDVLGYQPKRLAVHLSLATSWSIHLEPSWFGSWSLHFDSRATSSSHCHSWRASWANHFWTETQRIPRACHRTSSWHCRHTSLWSSVCTQWMSWFGFRTEQGHTYSCQGKWNIWWRHYISAGKVSDISLDGPTPPFSASFRLSGRVLFSFK